MRHLTAGFAIILFLVIVPPAFAKKTKSRKAGVDPSATVLAAIQQAKVLMVQGNRRQALDALERAAPATRSRADQREIAAKKNLFAEQFITAEGFQNFQEARGMEAIGRFEDCLRELDAVDEKDRDNLLALRLRARCQQGLRQFDAAQSTLKSIQAVFPDDPESLLDLVEISSANGQIEQGLAMLARLDPERSSDSERHAMLKARLLEQDKRPAEAAEVLQADQERNLEHVRVIFELGMLYSRMQGRDWQARKTLSLFVNRCKRLKEGELRSRRLEPLMLQAQTLLSALDQKLGI